jgi:uncharacterized membrane protein YjjP (DUF1212 family)
VADCPEVGVIVLWFAALGAAGWLIHPYTHPAWLVVLAVVGVAGGLFLAIYDKGAFRCLCGFGVGIDLMLAASLDHVGSAKVPVAVIGCVLVIGSLLAAATGKESA